MKIEITKEMALYSLQILQESFGVDPMYFEKKYALAFEVLRTYIYEKELKKL